MLAALSVMCQIGEREDLDRCIALAKSDYKALVMGLLNDGFLCDCRFAGIEEYMGRLENEGILIDEKPLSNRSCFLRFFVRVHILQYEIHMTLTWDSDMR
jgi:hypothetical protein